ncbi:MAG: lysozyme [Alphaproteobacteria bacterium]|nr:lysozyme [Alphaproteobacteria bacterium]
MKQLQTSKRGIEMIKQFEGLKLRSYLCPAGYKTIGYGHMKRFAISSDEEITEAQAENLLQDDLLRTEASLRRLIYALLSQNQFDALVSFTFNLGAGALQRSTLRRRVNDQCHDEVPREFRRWIFVGGRRSLGLLRRRNAEIELYCA